MVDENAVMQQDDLAELLAILQERGRELRGLDLGTYGRDTFTVMGGEVGFFYGSDGGDMITGNRGEDWFAGGARNDFIDGRFGNDILLGGAGADTVRGFNGDDEIHGNHGDDLLSGGSGDDVIHTGHGNDRVGGGQGDDVVYAGEGRNLIHTGGGADKVYVEGLISDYRISHNNGFVVLQAKDGSARHLLRGVETVEDENGNTIDPAETVTLQLLHTSDLEGNSDAVEAAPNFATIVDALREEFETTLVLSSGDNYIPSPFSNAAGSADPQVQAELNAVLNQVMSDVTGETYTDLETAAGRFDIAIMNAIGFDASALGNHEFDFGQEQLRTVTAPGAGWTGAMFPYLSANLTFEDESVLAPLVDADGVASNESGEGTIAPYAIIEKNGQEFGIIGATTQLLETLSSTRGDPDSPNDDVQTDTAFDDMQALADVLQPIVDDLEAQGVNKIILTSHLQQFALEQELAQLVDGIDIYLAGGSDTIVADGTDRLREDDEAAYPYPVVTKDAGGNDAVIMSTDGQYTYVGRLVVEFDAVGNLILSSIDEDVSGVYATDEEGVLDVTGASSLDEAIAGSDAGTAVRTLAQSIFDAVLVNSGQNYFGDLAVDLNGEREPGVRTEETNLGNLTADANLAYARQISGEDVTVSIKNGGGIRDSIAAGDGLISELEIGTVLAFNNTLSLVTVTPQELLAILEFAVAESEYDENGVPTNAQGRFPQIAGMAFSFDPTAPEGSKISDVTLAGVGPGGSDIKIVEDGALTADAATYNSIRVVTLNFLADGGDGYPFDSLSNPDRVDLFEPLLVTDGAAQFTNVGTEQDALAEYLAANYGVDNDPSNDFALADTDAAFDSRIVNLAIPGVSDLHIT